jgi:glycosyltransferase involved in cell wall biosynthesis
VKVLLSAYACEPDEVWVLTRSNNRKVIEAHPSSKTRGLHFIYHDLSGWLLSLKRKPWCLRVYVLLWQWSAYRAAAAHHRMKHFDQVYHVTFVGLTSGSFMGWLGIPFIVGPIAGGERATLPMRRSLPLRYKIRELIRDGGILLQRYSPFSRTALAAAERIYVATPESIRLVPKKWRGKVKVQLAVGSTGPVPGRRDSQGVTSPKFVFAGRLLYWKGIHLAIRALAKAHSEIPKATLTIVGDGPAEQWLRATANEQGVTEAVEFLGRVPHQQLVASFSDYRAMVFPSFHDSGGLVVIESLCAALPVICLSLGGPGIMVNESCGFVVSTDNADDEIAVDRLSRAMICVALMSHHSYEGLSQGALERASELSWSALTECVAKG